MKVSCQKEDHDPIMDFVKMMTGDDLEYIKSTFMTNKTIESIEDYDHTDNVVQYSTDIWMVKYTMLAEEEENEFYIKQEIFEKPISDKHAPYLVRSKIFVLKHYAYLDQIRIMSFHVKTESEDQEKIEFTAMRNKFMQRPAYQILPCRCTYMKEKSNLHRRIETIEENVKDCKTKLGGFQMNFKK